MKNILLLCLFPLLGFAQTQIGVDIHGIGAMDYSGESISISADGSTVAIGAPGNGMINFEPGYVHIYKRASGTWTQIGSNINGEGLEDYFGLSVSLSADGTILAIGAPGADFNGFQSGQVRIYKNVEGTWIQLGSNINGKSEDDSCGMSVSLSADGATVAIGSPYGAEIGSRFGEVSVYKNIAGTWTQIGNDIIGEGVLDYSGVSVSLSADGAIVAIGAAGNDGNGEDSGHVRIYKNNEGTWIQIGTDINGEATGDLSGSSVSLSADGNTVAIGSPYNDSSASDSGQVRVYRNMEGNWTQMGMDIIGKLKGYFGRSVSLSADGNIVAIGAGYTGFVLTPGYVHIYKYFMGAWSQLGVEINGKAEIDQGAYSVSLSGSGSTVAIGANSAYGNDAYSGHARVYDLSALLASDSFVLAHFSIYPNPTTEMLNIILQDNLTLEKVNIYNALGQLVKTGKQNNINVNSLSKGSYFVEVITSEGKATKTIVVE